MESSQYISLSTVPATLLCEVFLMHNFKKRVTPMQSTQVSKYIHTDNIELIVNKFKLKFIHTFM